ncbi:MAG: HEAT repeat domain-containing protein [Caldilinea sp. CFX5]|nr:HEAT repeat domain-containing protein [Caldilinea sp. CFX5]
MTTLTGAAHAALASDDPAVRFNAGLDLVKQGDAAGIPAVIEGFAHDSPSVRLFHAGKALAKLGAPAIPALEMALTADNPQVRMAAAHTLYQIDPSRLDQLLPLAIAAIQGDQEQAATDALDFLGEIGDAAQAAVPALLAALSMPVQRENEQHWFGDRRVLMTALLAKIREPMNEIVPALINTLQAKTPELRWGAACALGEIGVAAKAAVPALSALIRNENEVELVRVEAAYALAVMGEPVTETLPVLVDATQSADWWLRAFAVRILGEMGAPAGLYQPIQAFGWLDRLFMAVRNVARLPDPARQAVPLLSQALGDPDFNVRRNAAYALALVGAQAVAAIPALVTALHTNDIGPIAAEALAKVGEAALPALRTALAEEDDLVRSHAAYALKLITTPAAQALLDQTQAPPLTPTTRHFYHQVPVALDDAQCAAFEALYQATLAQGKGSAVEYSLPYPKHHFLRYVVEQKGCLIHGSGKADIDVLKPIRYGIDASDHGNVSGIYADRDYVRPIYFAVIDGRRAFGQHNGFFDLTVDGQLAEQEDQGFDRRYYKLAIGVNGLRRNPWRNGMIYILPPDTFVYQREWTSRAPVPPLMRLAVTPDDLPLRADVWGADWRTFDGDNWVRPDQPFPFLKDVRTTAIQPGGTPPWLRP